MKKNLILDTAHLLIKDLVTKDDILVDATLGNGNDSIYFHSLVKEIHAFDVQKEAIDNSQQKLNQLNIKNVHLYHDSHENILNHILDFKGVIFNLGYLPNSNKEIKTNYKTTINAVDKLINHIKAFQFIQLVVYIGHDEGNLESIYLDEYLKKLDQEKFKVMKIELPYQNNKPPYILMIYKIKDDN